MLIARYTANKSGVVPTFNEGYQYTINETESNGIYTVEINSDSDFTSCSFDNKNSKNNLLTVEYLKVTSSVTNMDGMFNNCSKLTQLDLSNFDTSNVTSMNYMFFNCSQLTQLDLSNFNTSKVTSMNAMFQYCSQLTTIGDLSNFNTSNVTSMEGVFKGCSQLTQLDLSNWVTNKIPSIRDMFAYCSQLTQLDVGNWDTKNVTDMRFTFESCSKLTQLDLSNWNTSNVTNTYGMFDGCSSLAQLDISNFDTSSITNTYKMFESCTSLNNVIATNVSTSTLSKLITELPTRTSDSYGTIRAKNITNEITSSANAKYWNVTDKMLIARYTANKSGVVPTFNEGYQYTKNETNSNGVYTVEINSDSDFSSCSFNGNTNLLTVEYLKITSNVTEMNDMFNSCSQLTQLDASNWDTKNVENMQNMFYDCYRLTQLDVSNWDTSNVTNMNYTFYNCSKLTQLDVSNWVTSNVTNMGSMFYQCSKLTQLDVGNFNTSKVTNMNSMFSTCSQLTQLDVSNFNTSKVTNMSGMFYNCSKLTQLDVSNWDTSSVTNMNNMFKICSQLNLIKMNNNSYPTINKIIEQLPTRTSDSYGTIKATETTDEITSSANAKYWNVDAPMLIARYTANASGVLPTFNSGYQYTVDETENDGVYTVKLYSDSDFTSCSFNSKSELLTVEYLKVTNNVTRMERMFYNCLNLTQLNLNDWDTSSVVRMEYMFQKCSSLTQLDVSNWNTRQVIKMHNMFEACSKLTQLDLSNWDTNKVTETSSMFYGCSQLTQLNISNFDTSNVQYMINMFNYCSQLKKIIATNVSTSTLSKLITELPTRTSDSYGTIKVANTTDEITSSANAKYWNIKVPMLVAKYTANVSGVLPTFNDGYQYIINETESNGIYTVEIKSEDDFTSCSFEGKSNLLTVEYLKVTDKVTSMYKMFYNCSQLTQLDVSNWDTSKVTRTSDMFASCSSLTQLDVSNWDTSSVTNMTSMFYNCSQLTQLDVSNFDTSKVTRMDYMFNGCSQLTQLDVSNFDTSQVTNMDDMFASCSKLTQLDVSNFDTSKVTSMSGMFYNCSQLTQLDVSNFDTSKVTSMSSMFYDCLQLNDIIATNVSTSTLSTLIAKIPTRTSDSYGTIISNGSTQDLVTSANAKYWKLQMELLIARYTANASGIVPTFNDGYQYTVNEFNDNGIYTVELSSDTDFTSCRFNGKSELLTVEYLKVTSNVKDISGMFQGCTQLTQLDVSNWDTSNVTNISYMFNGCSSLTQLDLSNFDTSEVTTMANTFLNCSSLTQLDLSNFDTNKVTNMSQMFNNCSSLTQLDVSDWNTSQVTNMSSMFSNCSKITELNVDNWKTENVEDMASIFYNCKEVAYLNLGGWDTRKVRDMDNMFGGCTVLSYLDLSNLKIDNVSNMNNMFEGCDALSFIGLVYSDISVLNKLPTFETMTLYVGGNINRSQYTGVSILKEYIEKEVKIISPIDLRSNGDVADRLYWNDEDKHYYIEQWIDSLTGEVLETPNIIAMGITTPIEIKQFTNVFTIDVKNLTPSYLNITTPHYYIPDDYEYKEEEEVEYFKQSFELRFPDKDDVGSDWGFAHVEGDYSMGLKRVIDWVDNCDDETFVRDFDKYFHRQYTLRYFLLVITLGMVDNLGKNMMLDTFDHKIWMPRFYDMDTICSYDNSGQIKFDVDIEMAQGYWNTSASRLWTRIRDLMHNDLVATYKDMRANGMSYESFMKYFYDEQIAQIPQKYYNMDADVKYLPFADAYIGKAHGDGYEHLKRWLKRRLIFTDTLYDYQPSYINDVLTIRANTTEKMTLEIETYTPVYQHLSWYNGQMDKQKIDGKTSVTFEGFAQASTDQEILIYGGSNIKSIKGISTCNPSQLLIGSATRLVELEARDCPMLSDINSMGANLLPHTYLNKLDLSGCTALSGNLNIQNSPLLIHLDVSRTGLTGINLPNAVKNMERMVFSECPNITAINMPNLYMPRLNGCKDMFKGCTNLKTVNLKGWITPNVTETNDMFLNCSSLTTLNLSDWDASSIISANNMFNGCSSVIDVTPPKNLFISHDISSMISLSRNEVLEWVDALSLIETNQTIILGSTLIVLLSEEDILRIINKGWSVG